MIVVDTKGDMFEALQYYDTIAHGANCQGVMGSGIAKPIRDRYPTNFDVYRLLCRGGLFTPGDILPVLDNGHIVINMATQNFPGPDARYEWVAESAQGVYDFCKKVGVDRVKMPRIGCGIGGLDWHNVRAILTNIGAQDVTVEVFYLED